MTDQTPATVPYKWRLQVYMGCSCKGDDTQRAMELSHFLGILTETYVNSIVVFRYIAIDVVKASVANLHVDVATKYQLQEADEGRDTLLRPPGEVS